MTKYDFIEALEKKLSGLPEKEVDDRLSFYIEIIDDKIEEGIPEEEAIAQIGSVDDIAEQIISDIPFKAIAKKRMKNKKRLKTWEIVLLALGSPVWIPLLAAAFVIILSIYIVLWSLVISLYAVFVSFIAFAFAGIIAGVIFAATGTVLQGIAIIGAGIFCAGLSIFLFFACKSATKGTAKLSKNIAVGIKKLFIKKEEA